ncbi:MAG: tetratricopeptide repeat protein [Bacteroidales bacterium]|jgi:tetratricopeptide (TPR) repeat protein|nr:tetratricopeptide repeat protein [Bacteroidales bacterium]
MNLKNKIILALTFLGISFLMGCSVEKNTSSSRAYHNLVLKYNIYFNANEAYKRGINRINSNNTDNYNEILPVFVESKEDLASSASGEMDKVIQKASKGIKIHSITKKPDMRGKNMSKKDREFYDKKEFNKWVDDCYMIMGKAYFIKRDYLQARYNFEFIARQFPELETRHFANLYLVRTFSENRNFTEAKETLDFIEAQKDLLKKLDAEFSVVYADYYLKQKQYDEAVPKLNRAIKNTKKKALKYRYTYILAQIYENQGNLAQASELYGQVAKKARTYEMEFNARINEAKCFMGHSKNSKDIRKKLRKMLRDDKNIEYKDQIYYTIAEMDQRAGQTKSAKENYRLSSEASVSNDYQKAISCMKLGEIYFDENDYKNAQIYYDTCMAFLPSTYEKYRDIRLRSNNLNELVRYTDELELQDSLQRLAKMPEKERNKIIDDIIAEIVKQEQLEREQAQQDQINSMIFDQQRGHSMNRVDAPAGGGWYFYNPAQLSFGKNEFNKKWGTRKNEDHWRRKNKAVIDYDDDDDDDGELADGETTKKSKGSNKSREYYLQDIPLTDSAMNLSHELIQEALFNMGRVYKDRFNDYPKAISAYEELNKRYANNEYLLLTYYNLYLLNKLVNNSAEETKYKDLVIQKFPETNYAKLLLNPNFVKELEQKRRQDEDLYIQVYDDYMSGKFAKVNSIATDYINQNPDNVLSANFDFMKVLTVGRTEDEDVFKNALIRFMQDYSEHELSNVAQAILEYFGTTDIEGLIADLKSRPTESLAKIETEGDSLAHSIPKEQFEFNDLDEHYYVIMLDPSKIDVKRLSFEIRNFNIFNFSMRTFNVINTPYNSNTELITVRAFKNQRQSVNYSKMIANSDDVFSKLANVQYKIFVISAENFTKLQKLKNINEYMQFYNDNYK